MEDKISNIFITGLPKVGKTTLVKKLISEFPEKIIGFFTEEILDKNQRIGFKIETTNKESSILAVKHIAKDVILDYNTHKIKHYKKYDVFIDILENVGVKFIEDRLEKINKEYCIVIDEIGSIECLSEKFCSLVIRIINSQIPLIATVRYKSHPFTDDIKRIKNSKIFVLERKNFDFVFEEVKKWLEKL